MLYSRFEPLALIEIDPLSNVGQLFGLVGVIETILGVPQFASSQSISPSPSLSILSSHISTQTGSDSVTVIAYST